MHKYYKLSGNNLDVKYCTALVIILISDLFMIIDAISRNKFFVVNMGLMFVQRLNNLLKYYLVLWKLIEIQCSTKWNMKGYKIWNSKITSLQLVYNLIWLIRHPFIFLIWIQLWIDFICNKSKVTMTGLTEC